MQSTTSRGLLRPERLAIVLALATAAAGCSGGKNGKSALIAVEDVAAGDDCDNGGSRVDVGLDENRDGVLDEEEIETTEYLCNGADGEDGTDGTDGVDGADGADGMDGADGADGSTTLATLTDLALHDADCPWGGVRIDAGVDDGSGGGTAGDGVLQDGEVTSTEHVCEPRPLFVVEPTTPPEGDEGTSTLTAMGGEGTDGDGGSGGQVDFYIDYGTMGGHVKLFRTGSADASFTLPTVDVAFGSNGVEITGDTTVQGLAVGATGGLAEGDLFTQPGGSTLLRWNGTSGEVVTGLHVADGATLTVEPRAGETRANLSFAFDVHNEGTITTALLTDGISRADLQLDCATFYGAEGSTIDTAGDDGTTVGGNGGRVSIDASSASFGGYANNGRLVNLGTIVTSGGEGESGGAAGDVSLQGGQGVHNTGELTAMGGTGTDAAGAGGNGGDVYAYTSYGDLANSAQIRTRGGNGAGTGGNGGYVEFELNANGHLLNSGLLMTRGGDGAAGAGGDAGDVDLYGYAMGIVSSGEIRAMGGTAASGFGGDGGNIYLYTEYNSGWEGEYNPPGDILISGSWNINGGQGESGGAGGEMEVYLDGDYAPMSQEIIFYGYTTLDVSGGAGSADGGQGGSVELYNQYSSGDGFPADYGPSGGVVNYLDIDTSGGVGSSGYGGSGGSIEMYTDDYYGFGTEGEIVMNAGNLTTRGGSGGNGGGAGDSVWLWGYNMVDNSGDIDTSGGEASGDGAWGGEASYINLVSELGPSINTGSLTAAGGDAMGAASSAGDGDDIEMLGTVVNNQGTLSVAGGDANETDGFGGDGGNISFYGSESETSLENTMASLAGGTGGDTPGEDGLFYRDGFDVSAQF